MKPNGITAEIKSLFKKYSSVFVGDDVDKFAGYLYIMLTLITVAFFGLFAIGPTLNTVSNLNKQYKDNMVIYDALSQKLTNLALLDSHYKIISPHVENVYAAIPKSNEIPKLTRQLENLAASHNIQITKLTFGTVEIFPNSKKTPLYSFTFTINVAGNQINVNSFISDVINFEGIVGVDKIVTGTSPENKYTTSFTGRVFFAP